ncbi:MAG: sulfatase-like hydrolase/transferase, partial [Chthoniobacteraceae bacterium]
MKRFFTPIFATLLLAQFTPIYAAVSAKPNIIFILADDLGFAEIGANGADHYRTPNIDSIARTGVRFSHFYTAPLCGPSRALILTGRYGFRSGAVTQDACASVILTGEKAEVMIPAVLKKAGYATAMIGKWGQLLPSGDAAEWGFDHMLSFRASGVYWNKAAAATWVKRYELAGDKAGDDGVRANPGPYNIDAKKLMMSDTEYMPDLMHKDAVAFLDENKGKPFFLYYSMSHVHSQILPTPDSAPPAPGTDATARFAQLYADNITYMDKLVGKLLAELDRLKLRENTVIFFMGDNGTAKANADRATIGGRRLIGQKGGMEEGGGLVPFVVSWQGVTPGGKLNE